MSIAHPPARRWGREPPPEGVPPTTVASPLRSCMSAAADLLSTSLVWDPVTGLSSPGGALAEPRSFHTATGLADGRVLVVGGSGLIGEGPSAQDDPLASAEVWTMADR